MGLSDLSANFLDGPSGYEPQRNNNCELFLTPPQAINNFNEVLQFAIQQFPLPKSDNALVEVKHMNEMRKFAGAPSFQDLQVTFIDYIDLDTAAVMKAWRLLVYNPMNGKIGWKRQYAASGHANLYGPNGQFVRTWNLIGVWPTAYDPGETDQTSDDVLRISCTFAIDKAILADSVENPAGPIGQAYGTDVTTDSQYAQAGFSSGVGGPGGAGFIT